MSGLRAETRFADAAAVAVEVFAACFPKREHRELLKAVKRLADALGERRDPDVAIAAVERIADGLSPAERPGIDGLVEELRQDQARGNEALGRELERARASELGLRLHRLAMSARGQGRPAP